MVTYRNRRTPLGNCALIPANTEVVRSWQPGIGDDSKRLATLSNGSQSLRSLIVEVVRETCYRTMFRRSSRPLLGVSASKPKRGRSSVNKGTREAHSIRVITQPSQRWLAQVSPMRRMSGGVAVVVRGWESQLHGEGRQEVSFWMTERFINREGSR